MPAASHRGGLCGLWHVNTFSEVSNQEVHNEDVDDSQRDEKPGELSQEDTVGGDEDVHKFHTKTQLLQFPPATLSPGLPVAGCV